MANKKIVLVHSSAIIQKGLTDLLLHTCHVSVSLSIFDYADLLPMRIKKSILFIDIELLANDKNLQVLLSEQGNSVFAIADSNNRNVQEITVDGLIFINDNLQVIQRKLLQILPVSIKINAEPAGLTQRETEVLKLVARGNSNKETADQLSISLHTVISHRKNICRKLEIKTVSGLTLYALINNLIN